MTALTPALDTLLAGDRAMVTLLIEANLPGHDLRLLVGAGSITWGVKTFVGEDATFGTFGEIDEIQDGDGDEAPSLGFTMYPPSATAAATLCSATYQGCPVYCWLAGIYASGALVPDPYLLFSGFIDQPTLTVGKSTRSVAFQCVSQFDLLLEADEGARLSDAFHQSIWPGETGFANVTGIEKTIYWGTANPNPGAVSVGASAINYANRFRYAAL